jgi:hypothetical protein
MTLPIVLGFLTMANVESGNWVMNAAEQEQQRAIEAKEARRVATGGKVRIQPGKIIKTSLRALSIFRIIVAALTPGVCFNHLVQCISWDLILDVERGIILDHFSRFWSNADMDFRVDGCSKKETACLVTFYHRYSSCASIQDS